ncbi:hypothetical protein JD965_05790 [Bacillus siamensis]|uniref:hypothetical protein n=1 Tax=Bacillus siamensis TaxID=659243 RepID=UPI0018E5D51A|nr:hypothetical protein [Bacillus siamensis]QQD83099.1 hypothetical protein JD965_05790 [Bacillus siamensis]
MKKQLITGALSLGLLITGSTNVFAAEIKQNTDVKATDLKPLSSAYTTVSVSNEQVTLSIGGLENPFTSKYYKKVAWTTNGNEPSSTNSNVLITSNAGDTLSKSLSLDTVKRKLGDKRVIYGWAQATNNIWYPAGSDTISF